MGFSHSSPSGVLEGCPTGGTLSFGLDARAREESGWKKFIPIGIGHNRKKEWGVLWKSGCGELESTVQCLLMAQHHPLPLLPPQKWLLEVELEPGNVIDDGRRAVPAPFLQPTSNRTSELPLHHPLSEFYELSLGQLFFSPTATHCAPAWHFFFSDTHTHTIAKRVALDTIWANWSLYGKKELKCRG